MMMTTGRKLPDAETLRRHVEDGLSKRQIADMYGVTTEAVRQQLIKLGIQTQRQRPRPTLPWRLSSNHQDSMIARRLRLYSKAEQGFPLSVAEDRLLREFKDYMDGGNPVGLPLVVHYTRQEGFWLEPRQPGDDGYTSAPRGD